MLLKKNHRVDRLQYKIIVTKYIDVFSEFYSWRFDNIKFKNMYQQKNYNKLKKNDNNIFLWTFCISPIIFSIGQKVNFC
jgi:hypothetical protein